MKKFLIPVVLVCLSFGLQAQQLLITFSKEKAQFTRDMGTFMTANKMEQNVNAMNTFEKMVKDGKIPDTWFPKMADNANAMSERNMSPFTHFLPYLNAVMNAANTKQTDAHFLAWSDFIGDVIDVQKKGDNTGFLKAIDFSTGFFQDGSLLSTPAKAWKILPVDYKFESGGLRPHISFPATTILGCVKGDTLAIRQTAGDYYPLETKWEGKSGRVDWGRAGLDANKVYCTFKEYSINTSNFNYSVDTVTFFHSEYFKVPLIGRLQDKMVSSADSGTMSYPRFQSYNAGLTIHDIAPNVSYTGGFSLFGVKVMGYGSAEEKALLSFYARDGKTKVLSAKAATVSIKKGEELGADKAEVSIYFGTDSIYHPQLNVVYKIQKREIRLLRGETGMGKAKFTDSYHNHEFQTDAIFWNMDSSILNLKILSGAGQKPGIYESVNYFQKELIRKTQGFASYEPLSVLKRLYEKTQSRDINATDLARALDPNLKEGELKSLLYSLVEGGFILYNEDLGVVTVKDKAINYVLANAKKIDYDLIHIKSAPQSGNDYIDLKSSNIDLKGVKEVPISDTAFVYFVPKNNAISLQKDRNMEFNGLIYAGRMDLYGEKYKFQYAPFTVDLTKVDTMRINVPDSNKVDDYGNPILKPIRSRIENMKGLLEIDAPINKSGRTKLPQFPRLYSREKSYIYYDDPTVAKGAYGRKDFFFELEPFRLDSLNNFSVDIINWKGKLQSGGILPDIKDSVKLQADGSLGFKSETPPGGYELYKGKGKYYGKFELNYDGMNADGRIIHSTADFTSHDIRLYPDSMLGTTDTITIAKTFEGVKTPSVKGTADKIFWRPKADSMHINMMKPEQPFYMYDDSTTTFKGNLLLTSRDLRGNGLLDWNEATLESKDFAFHTMDLSADTAALNIKSISGDRVTFKTPNVNAKVDFKTRIGDFVSNQKNIPTEFAYNQYTTAINQFKWFMDEKILDFKAPPQGPGEYFTSTRPDQKGLRFLGKRATYSLITSVLRVEQVPEIRVADASVVPDSGVVTIEAEAKMHQLINATIYADTINKYHKLEKATVDIYSKEELKGFGIYKYNTKDLKEILYFSDISCKKEKEGERKKAHDIWQLTGKAPVAKDSNFVIYPNVAFNGDANLLSVNKLLNFKGYATIGLKHAGVNSTDFFIDQDVNPDKLELKYDDKVKNANGNAVSAGIHLNPADDAPEMYATIMGNKKNGNDITLFQSTGIITQAANGEYAYGDEKKIKDNTPRGNVLRYDDKKGIAKAEGAFTLGTNFGVIKTKAAGFADVLLDSAKYKFNLTFGIDANIDSKLQERLEFYMGNDNVDLPDIAYESEKQKKAIYMLTDEKDDRKYMEEFEKLPVFNKRPKNFDYNMVFSDVNFVYDSFDISLRSVGKIGVAMVGKKVVNKKLDGYIEFQYRGGADVFIIYLKTGTNDWLYMEYRPGTLSVLSSFDDINNGIGAIAPDKRKIKGDNGRFYMYTLGSSMNKTDFVEYMGDKAKGINRERLQFKDIPAMEDSALLFGTDSGAQNMSPEEKQEMIRQNEINNFENMKMNNQQILSGPPPDRIKKDVPAEPKAEPVQEAVPTEQPKQEVVPTEQPKQNAAPAEQPKQDAPKVEEQKIGEPAPTEQPKKKGKKGKDKEPESQSVETPVQEAPKEEVKPEAPKVEEQKIGEPEPTEQPKKKGKKEKTFEDQGTVTPAQEAAKEPAANEGVKVEDVKPASDAPAEQPKKKGKKKKDAEETPEGEQP